MPEQKTKVLLAEDEEVARDILSFYLNNIFDEVVVAKDGLEGLQIYNSNTQYSSAFDLVITDIMMPNLDGLKMLEKIHLANKDQKFIIVSAYKDEEKLLKSIELKVLGYFVKPLNVDNMMDMLKKAKEEVLKDKESKKSLQKINSLYSYDINKKILYEKTTIVKLSKKESTLLYTLIENRGKIISTKSLKQTLWKDEEKLDATFRTLMKRLKDKIKTKDFIISIKSQGYIIE